MTRRLLFLSTLTGCGPSIQNCCRIWRLLHRNSPTCHSPEVRSLEALSPWDYLSRLLSSTRSHASTRIMSSIFLLSQWLQFLCSPWLYHLQTSPLFYIFHLYQYPSSPNKMKAKSIIIPCQLSPKFLSKRWLWCYTDSNLFPSVQKTKLFFILVMNSTAA